MTLKCTIRGISGSWIPSVIRGIYGSWIPSVIWEKRNRRSRTTLTCMYLNGSTKWNEDRSTLTSSLTINSALETDSGFYRCLLQKKLENIKSTDIELSVLMSKYSSNCCVLRITHSLFVFSSRQYTLVNLNLKSLNQQLIATQGF